MDGNPTNERERHGQERQQVGVAYGLVRVGDSYSRAEGPMAPSIIFKHLQPTLELQWRQSHQASVHQSQATRTKQDTTKR